MFRGILAISRGVNGKLGRHRRCLFQGIWGNFEGSEGDIGDPHWCLFQGIWGNSQGCEGNTGEAPALPRAAFLGRFFSQNPGFWALLPCWEWKTAALCFFPRSSHSRALHGHGILSHSASRMRPVARFVWVFFLSPVAQLCFGAARSVEQQRLDFPTRLTREEHGKPGPGGRAGFGSAGIALDTAGILPFGSDGGKTAGSFGRGCPGAASPPLSL